MKFDDVYLENTHMTERKPRKMTIKRNPSSFLVLHYKLSIRKNPS